jgi:K(+)-stimulated pyrophosphate-energized sodium pump
MIRKLQSFFRASKSSPAFWVLAMLIALLAPKSARASEADLHMPNLNDVKFLNNSIGGATLLTGGLVICVAGLAFGLVIKEQLRKLPVHRTMAEVSETIYTTCKTYLQTQGKFILILELFIGAILIIYFGFLADYTSVSTLADGTISRTFRHGFPPPTVALIILFSLIGIAGSYMVAWFGIRVNTYANSRTALASLAGKPYPVYAIPLKAGMSIGMVLISVELFIMLCILLFIPSNLAGPCFIGFAVGESLGAAALRVAGGIFTKIADIGADLMKIVFDVKEDDARNPGVIADCVGDNAGDSVGPTADGFETYGVTGVALITFILLAMPDKYQVTLLVWIFTMRLMMVITSGASYLLNEGVTKARFANANEMDFEKPLTNLVILTSILSIIVTYAVSFVMIHNLGDGSLWWKLSTIISCGTAAGALIPEFTKIFTSTKSRHVREVVDASREGGASLNVLSGLVAGNFSAFWLGMVICGLMAVAYLVSGIGGPSPKDVADHSVAQLLNANTAPAVAVFAFGLVAFGFLGMGPVTIAVDSYGPVTDNAQSVYELSLIEQVPDIKVEVKRDFGIDVDFERAKHLLEENDGAGNTFKATAKPVLIGTAVVGATTMIFSIIMVLTHGLTDHVQNLSILHAPFLLGITAGGSVIYWFSGASMQAVVTGAYRAVEFIKKNMKLDGAAKASIEDSKKVVAICTKYAQAGMFNIFLAVFFITLAFACLEAYFFIGFLISLATFGLFQAIFMANAGGAWDNAKKIVEVELREKGTPLHAATVVGDTVGDPFKDTSSVAMNPIIKFTTLFGLLAVELSENLRARDGGQNLTLVISGICFLIALCFVYRSFYGMRIKSGGEA